MKKIFVAFVVMLMSTTLFAREVKILSGSADYATADAKVYVEVDFSKARWEKEQSFEAFCGEDFQTRVELCTATFKDALQKYYKKSQVVEEQDGATHKMVFHVIEMERKMGGEFGQFYINVSGLIDVVDLSTGETVCTIEIKRLSGRPDYVPNDRLAKCFNALGKKVAKL